MMVRHAERYSAPFYLLSPAFVRRFLLGISVSTMDDENQIFSVVVNGEGQHSIWPDFKAVPAGWQEVGFKGLKKDCLEHITKVWTDTRPLSLQRRTARKAP